MEKNESIKVAESRGYWSKTHKITRDQTTNPFHPNNFPKISMSEFDRNMEERKKNQGFLAKESADQVIENPTEI